MCGIAGFVQREGLADRDVVYRMMAALAHRGPDGDGCYLASGTALGHRRLSIIDLEGGAQPLCNEDGSVWVTYNGEIYNEPQLRERLRGSGHHFRTHCDTESLVHLYEEEGLKFPTHLNGMFGMALWDAARQRLVLARDRMGQKPLYYAVTRSGTFVFASEPKAILAHPEFERALDLESLARYLFYEYIPGPWTIWKGMSKLPPAHLLVFDVATGTWLTQRYWSPPLPNPDVEPPPFPEAKHELWDRLLGAVERHRRSDVPLGVFLSGGLDSSSVAAALAEIQPARTVRTFSIGFEDRSFDESHHARSVARFLGTDHHDRIFSAQTVLELLPEVAGWLDEPFGDASILPTHLLSRFARENVTVAMGGDGADELLAGYPTFEAEQAARWYRRLPARARLAAGAAVRRLPVDHGNLSLDFKLKQFLRGASEPEALAHQRWIGSFTGAELDELLVDGDPVLQGVEVEHMARAAAIAPEADRLTRSLLLYQNTYLPDDILTKVDRASMACSLEVRAPMLDADLVDWVEALPASYKYGRRQTKRLLKAAVEGRLPRSILNRPKKGFGIPVARWLRGPLQPLLSDLLGSDRLRRQGLFHADVVARYVQEHLSGVRDHRKPLWTLLMFQLWHDQWLE